MRKKGDLPSVILFFGAIFLAGISLFAFLTNQRDFGGMSSDFSKLMARAELNEYYVKSLALSSAENALSGLESNGNDLKELYRNEITRQRNLSFGGMGNFLGKVRSNDFIFEKKGELYYFEAKGIFVQSEVSDNKITRYFDINKSFDRFK